MRDDNPVNDVSHYSKKLFEVLNVIPADQVLVTAAPETSVRDALGLLDRHGFSQLPVVNGRKVLGNAWRTSTPPPGFPCASRT